MYISRSYEALSWNTYIGGLSFKTAYKKIKQRGLYKENEPDNIHYQLHVNRTFKI